MYKPNTIVGTLNVKTVTNVTTATYVKNKNAKCKTLHLAFLFFTYVAVTIMFIITYTCNNWDSLIESDMCFWEAYKMRRSPECIINGIWIV